MILGETSKPVSGAHVCVLPPIDAGRTAPTTPPVPGGEDPS